MLSKKLLSMFNRSSRYREVELKASITSDKLPSEKDKMKSLSKQNKNRSATKGTQSVSIGIPITYLYNLEPNLVLSKRKVRAAHTF